ncbi:MAG: hypothetical protein EHM23_24485 [Acidobacteria bacterium]|nr:MAG: hypothetical protein EHM23_24485 [Acidobacteriota bacterium]
MKSKAKLVSSLLLGLLMSCQVLAYKHEETSQASSTGYDQFAHFIAGQPTGRSPWATLEQTPLWEEHARRCNQAWLRLERNQLSRIRTWSSVELKEATAEARTVFYPFGGPDFLYAQAFFPNASDYILVGLEPAGVLPDWQNFSEENWTDYLTRLLKSLEEVLNLTFFKTDDMKQDLEQKEGSGILPILLFFLARTGHEIVSIDRVYILPNGDVGASENFRKPRRPGIHFMARRISFQAPAGGPRYLYYFPLDLSNYSLQRRPGFAAFLKKRQSLNSFVKAASYLMFRPAFSDVRSLLVNESDYLLQDDSGVPIEYFEASKWRLRFYGRYDKPIQLFEERHQPALDQYYRQTQHVPSLSFGFGYRLQPDRSNLILAKRVK